MKRCPITYQEISPDFLYSKEGLRKISPKLKDLHLLAFSAEELRKEAIFRAEKMSIQGVQSKLSATINTLSSVFDIVDKGGLYILKPQSEIFDHLPENEDLTMKMAKILGIEVPIHGLVYSKDMSLTYFIKRFDRGTNGEKIAVEDFAQLTESTRDTKYNSTLEKVIHVLENFTSFPVIEKAKFFKIILFCYVTGNEDMHLKNFSLIRRGNIVSLSPSYDLLNTSLALKNPKEEMALPLRGKKSNLNKADFIEYLGKERLSLPLQIIDKILSELSFKKETIEKLILVSFLNDHEKNAYLNILHDRYHKLFL